MTIRFGEYKKRDISFLLNFVTNPFLYYTGYRWWTVNANFFRNKQHSFLKSRRFLWKKRIVTGGTRGIGYAIVHKFLQHGAKVVLFGSREETVAKAVASLKEENPDWEVSGAWPKLTDAAAMVDEINKVKEKYGKIDILVNNAGVSDSTPIDKYTADADH